MSGRTAGAAGGRRTGGVDKAWASGRILTPEQRARKQEADRKANRFLKKEVQDRLSLLETRVQELEKSRPSNRQLESGIELGGDGTLPFRGSVADTQDSDATGISSKVTEWNASGEGYFPDNGQPIDQPSAAYDAGIDISRGTEQQTDDAHIAPDLTDVVTAARTRPDGRHMTCFLNNLVNYIRTMAPGVVCFDDQFNQDIIVSSVLKGWEHTMSRYQQKCPLWEILRLVDSYLFKDCNFVERISALRMLHKRYLFEVNANLPTVGPPPPWFRPRFSEKVFFHDPVIDHLTWPRLRDRLIASEQDKMTNKFWLLFVKNLHVAWRYEPIDIMTFSPDTQLYQLTPIFENAIMDISSWRMDMDFFRGIPQLAGDVPPYNYMPLRTVAPKFGGNSVPQAEILSPRSNIQHEGQQHTQEALPSEPWVQSSSMQAPPVFHENAQLESIKMPPGGVWQNFYAS